MLADDEVANPHLAQAGIHVVDEQLGEQNRLPPRFVPFLLEPEQDEGEQRSDHVEPALDRVGDPPPGVPGRRPPGLDQGRVERPKPRPLALLPEQARQE